MTPRTLVALLSPVVTLVGLGALVGLIDVVTFAALVDVATLVDLVTFVDLAPLVDLVVSAAGVVPPGSLHGSEGLGRAAAQAARYLGHRWVARRTGR